MKDNKDINKIRELIARWYSGETTPADDRELRDLLSSHSSLPPDLEEERAFFDALFMPEEDIPAIPSEYAHRISDALEKEIAESGNRDMDSSAFRSVRKRRWMWAAAGVAVCLMGSFITFRMMDNPELTGMGDAKMAVNVAVPKAADDTIQMHTLKLASDPVSGNIASAKNVSEKKLIRKRPQNDKKKVNHRSDETSFEGWDEYNNDKEKQYLSHEEEVMLAKNNYRVVRNEEEAESIITSIFGRMDSQMAMEGGKLSLIEADYHSEIERISDKFNSEIANEQYHEHTPI